MKASKFLFILFWILIYLGITIDSHARDRITNKAFDELVRTSANKINAQIKKDILEDAEYDQFYFDLRERVSECKAESSVNEKLKSLYNELPNTMAYFVVMVDYRGVDLLSDEALQQIQNLRDPDKISEKEVERIKGIFNQVDELFLEELYKKINTNIPYVFLSVYHFKWENFEEEGMHKSVDGCDYFDARLREDLRNTFEERCKNKVPSYSKGVEGSVQQVCNSIFEEITGIADVIREIKNAEKLKILHETDKKQTIIEILESLFENQIHDFTYDQRIRLLNLLSSSDNKEKASVQIVRLIEFRPDEQCGDLKKGIKENLLLKKFINGSDGIFEDVSSQTYANLIKQLCLLAHRTDNPNEKAKNFDPESIYYWKKESVYGRYRVIDEWTHTMRHLSGGDIEITSNYVRDHELSVLLGDQKYTSYTRQIDPFDEIGIILLENNDQELFPGSKVNTVYPIPSIYLPYASDKRIDTDKKKRLFEAIKGVSFAVGIGELVAAKTSVQYVFAFAELSPVIIDEVLTIDPVRNKILSINGGKTFLDVWGDVKVVLQAAVILRGAQQTLKSFMTSYDEIKEPLKSKLSPDEFKKVDDEVSRVKKRLENEGEQLNDIVKAIPLDELIAMLRKSISTKIFGNSKYSLILTDDQLSKIIELGNKYKFSSNMIEAIVLAHSRRYTYAKFEDLIELMELLYKRNINNSFEFNEGYDLLKAYERNEFFILFSSKVDPLDFFTKGYEQSHLSEFRNGVSFFCPQIMIDKYGKLLGRLDGVYVIPKYKMDELLNKTNKDIGLIEDELAIPRGSWVNQKMSRVDVDNIQNLNLRLTSGAEEAANVFYIPGGFTANGQKEAVINAIPEGSYKVTPINF